MPDTPKGAADSSAALDWYEFSDEENTVFRQLALRMRVVGIALLTWGILQGPKILADGDIGAIMLSLGLMTSGVWTIRTAHSFRAIHQTQGSDIAHLMSALRSVHKLYTLVAGIITVIIVWILLALAFTLVVSLT